MSEELAAVRDRNGRTREGQSALLARQLIECGVHFVTVATAGWDTHDNNFNHSKDTLLPPVIAVSRPCRKTCPSAGCWTRPFIVDREVRLRITATLRNPDLKSTFTGAHHNDSNLEAPFIDRAILEMDRPESWESVGKVEVTLVQARGTAIPYRLIGHAVELVLIQVLWNRPV